MKGYTWRNKDGWSTPHVSPANYGRHVREQSLNLVIPYLFRGIMLLCEVPYCCRPGERLDGPLGRPGRGLGNY